MGDQHLQKLQQEVDEIGSLMVGTVQQVNDRSEQVPDMMDRLQNLNEDCEVHFQTARDPAVSKTRSSTTTTTTGTSTRSKIIIGTCIAAGLILIILICVLSINGTGAESEGMEAGNERHANLSTPAP